MQTISSQSGAGFILKKSQKLRVQTSGQQVSDLFCVNAHEPQEHLSSARSMDYNDSIYLTTGCYLYSNRSQPLLKIIEDTCGRHDLLMPPCSLKMFQIVDPTVTYHPSCHENLSNALAPHDVSPDRITNAFNLFMNVTVAADGRVEILPPTSKSGDYVVLEAQVDLIVGITACAHEETNAGNLTPIFYEIF